MKISTIRDFCDHTPSLLRSKDPVVVTDQGHVTGVFFPCPEASIPLDLKRDLFGILSDQLRREAEHRGLTEEDIEADFNEWREKQRKAGGSH